MVISFGINNASLSAQRNLAKASDENSKISERLSSGLRINSASDDPASLSVLSTLNSSSKIYTQGIRNLNDGVSLISIADSAISSLTDITVRLKELATQASNGSYTKTQRSAIDSEAQALSAEYTRITKTTKFNGTSLLDSSLAAGLTLQAGDGTIASSLGGAKGTGTFTVAATTSTPLTNYQDISLGDIDGDGNLDQLLTGNSTVQIALGAGDGSFIVKASYSIDGQGQKGALVDLNNDGNLDILTAGNNSGSGRLSVRLGNGNGTFGALTTFQYVSNASFIDGFSIADIDNDGKLDVGILSNNGGLETISISRGNGDGTFQAAASISAIFSTVAPNNGNEFQFGDLNGDGNLDIAYIATGAKIITYLGNGDATFGSATTFTMSAGSSTTVNSLSLGDIDGDGKLDAVASLVSGTGVILKGTGTGTFTQVSTYSTGSTANDSTLIDINGDGFLDLIEDQVNFANAITIRTGNGNGTFNAAASFQSASNTRFAIGDLNNDGVYDIAVSATGGTGHPSYLQTTQSGVNPLLNFSLKTKAEARSAQSLFDQKLNQLTAQRGQIGAFQSRLDTATNFLTNIRDQYQGAASRIGDADVAADSADYIRTQILQQAATAVLAQANQAPQIALNLLSSANTSTKG